MTLRKSYIAPLAFLMLILFVSPMAVKAVHHHLPMQFSAPADSHGKSISALVRTCPVCQFEFVTFIAIGNQEYTHYSLLSSLPFCEPTLGLKGNALTHYSLRAPPVN